MLPNIKFLGILIDTQVFELRLPVGKIQRLRSLLQGWGKKKACTKRELESLLGHLSHAASIVRPGRTFLRQLFSLLRGVKAPSHFVRLNVGARADLKWWECFLQEWCGSSFFPLLEPAHQVFSDASGAYGCGAVVDAESWFQVSWPEEWEAVAACCGGSGLVGQYLAREVHSLPFGQHGSPSQQDGQDS